MTIYTLGYHQGWTYDRLDQLLDAINGTLVDIRLKAWSSDNHAHWRGPALHQHFGQRYRHIPKLGNQTYSQGIITLPPERLDAGIEQIAHIPTPNIVLMCACRNTRTCHRRHVGYAVAQALSEPLQHIDITFLPLPEQSYWVLSVAQPWASLIMHGYKTIETRNWKTYWRGPLLIHASKTYGDMSRNEVVHLCATSPFRDRLWAMGYQRLADMPHGAVLGSVFLDRVEYCHEGYSHHVASDEQAFGCFWSFHEDRYAWMLEQPHMFREPVVIQGKPGLWTMTLPEQYAGYLAT